MGNDYGPVSIKVRLNAEEAKREIAELRREIQLNPPPAVQGRSPAQQHVLRKTNPRAGHPTVSGASGDPHEGQDPYMTHDNIADGLRLLKWLRTTDRMRKFAPIHVQKAMEDASLVNRGLDYASEKLGLAPEAAGTVGGVATTAAALYAATSAVAKVAPYALKAIESAGATLPPGLSKFLDDFKGVINNLEHRVSNVVKAPKEAFDMWTDGARISGQLPDFLYYWNQRYDIGVAEDDLAAKFDHFKRMEVAQAVGKGVGDSFQRSFDR